ncbi:CD3072 family TudS-related putative desulfidase [Anoxynatronum buryatiense]|uniref:Predicted secreted protein n=1 Tax=Anoxynatronum buryatiense TaxID=489973 RepID=A0AA46AHU1_9CLOT|nr:CD3072 family TudS-related putative desulfidase [Anoxynatronum buryatiense]SMP43393.1 Predicted secreted protein [Anoxynatronum buryatiense]
MIKRKKQLLLVAHCVLNQNAVIRDWERAQGGFNQLVQAMLAENLGIIQLPCPEFTFSGEGRPPRTKDEYNTPAYRTLCRRLAQPVVEQAKEYQRQGYIVRGLVGIGESPSCDTLGNRGIFMEELLAMMSEARVELKTFDVPEDYLEGHGEKALLEFDCFIK